MSKWKYAIWYKINSKWQKDWYYVHPVDRLAMTFFRWRPMVKWIASLTWGVAANTLSWASLGSFEYMGLTKRGAPETTGHLSSLYSNKNIEITLAENTNSTGNAQQIITKILTRLIQESFKQPCRIRPANHWISSKKTQKSTSNWGFMQHFHTSASKLTATWHQVRLSQSPRNAASHSPKIYIYD